MASEQRGFVFGLTFIVIFSVLVATIPTDLQGLGETGDMVTPLDPSIISDFDDSKTYGKANLTAYGQYVYDLGNKEWVFSEYTGTFQLGAKVLIGGILWLGHLDSCKFISPTGEDHGSVLQIADIAADADNGTVRYSLQSIGSGNSMGGFVVYWNTTTYSDPADAWTNEILYLLHGVGFDTSATADIGALLVSLLLLQLPDVPLLVNILLVTPIWASIIFILWYVIKEMIPFV